MCCTKSRKVSESVFEVAHLAVALTGVADGLSTFGARLVLDPCIGELEKQLSATRAAVVTLTTKMADL